MSVPTTPSCGDPALAEQADYEVELAAVAGERARRVPEAGAREYIAGYTRANDVSPPALQFADESWVRGKSLNTFCPLDPSTVTEDEVGDPENFKIWSELNGKRMQESTTGNMIFGIDEHVSFYSDAFILLPSDVILTGAPTGVGVFRDPPEFLGNDDVVDVGIEGIGTFSNPSRTD